MEHRTALGLFLALAVNRPVAALNTRVPVCRGAQRALSGLVDVDANLLHPDLASDIDQHIEVNFFTAPSTLQTSALEVCQPTVWVYTYSVLVNS